MIRCRKPLILLCDGASRLVLNTFGCRPCSVEPNRLILTKGGCPEYEEVGEVVEEEPPCGCPPSGYSYHVVHVQEVQKSKVIYPLHEVDDDGNAVFVLDNKLALLGPGRYNAVVEFGTCGRFEFDVQYACANMSVQGIDVAYDNCGVV